jgi:hypothetical protein
MTKGETNAMDEELLARIGSRKEFHDAIRAAVVKAADAGSAEICLVDVDFQEWPLNQRAVIEALGRWATSQRRLVAYAHSFDTVARSAPRFVEWRRQWSHIVQCRTDPEIEAQQVPTLLLVAGEVAVRLLDPVRYRGVVSGRAGDHAECRQVIDALLQRSVEAFPPTTLGL